MAKAKTSAKQKSYSRATPQLRIKAGLKLKRHHPTKALADEKRIASVIWECLKNNDPDGVIEVLEAHFDAVNKLRMSREAKIPRSTLYHSLTGKNPTLKTLAKLVHAVA